MKSAPLAASTSGTMGARHDNPGVGVKPRGPIPAQAGERRMVSEE